MSAIRDLPVQTSSAALQRAAAETRQSLQRLSRVRIVVAACTHTLVHAADETTMLAEMCRRIVELGGHRSAWIGFAEQDAGKSVRPAAAAGIGLDEVRELRLSWAEAPGGRGAVGRALRSGQATAIDDYLTQPEYAAWREFARVHGFRSGLALPLPVDDASRGVLMINSAEARRFDVEEIALFEELSRDIAFGVRSLRARHSRDRAEQALRESEEHLRQLTANIPEAVWIAEAAGGQILHFSPALARITGWWLAPAFTDAQHLLDIVAPEDCREVMRKSQAAPRGGFEAEYRVVRPDGTRRWVRTRTFPVRDAAGVAYRFAGVMEDITEKKDTEERLAQLALYDALTNLPNRTLFRRILEQTVASAAAEGRTGAVLFVDLDRFKNVNDTLGHAVGDDLLREAAARLVRSIRARDTLGRLGGDEFAILLPGLESGDAAAAVAQKVLRALADPFTLEGQDVFVGASVGIAVFPADGEGPEALLRAADAAMYRAKSAGRNAYRFYKPEMNAHALERLQFETLLRRAVERSEFHLHYQPKLRLRDGCICGAEVLLRWASEQRGPVAPERFIPLLEETGLIVPVGEWVIAEVCRQIRAWRDAGRRAVPVAVNLSARQFQEPGLVAAIRRATRAEGVAATLLEFEITEGTLMSHHGQSLAILDGIKRLGASLALDDFGTGYSSLAYLKRFPLDTLKVDRSFVRDSIDDADDAAIVRAIVRMAQDLGLKVVAEGVETEAQVEFLRGLGCDEVQGYLCSPPLAADAFAELLRMEVAA